MFESIKPLEKDKIFFGEEGLTSTSANHVANLAKEYYRTIEEELKEPSFVSKEVEMLESTEKKSIIIGADSQFLNSYQERILEIAKAKALIAWLREAIAAKERLVNANKNMSDSDLAEEMGLEEPEGPRMPYELTTDDVTATWNIKERNRYYYLETLCATIGSYIHRDGEFAVSRAEFYQKIAHPTKVEGRGKEMVIYTYQPSVSKEEVENVFFQMQDVYRTYQAELNAMKHTIEVTCQTHQREAHAKYTEELFAYNRACELFKAQIKAERLKRIAKAQTLKIVIPNSLKEAYEQVQMLGKKKD